MNLYSIKTSIQSAGSKNGNQYVIYVLKESIPRLREVVKPYMVGSMLYKLGLRTTQNFIYVSV